MSVSDAEKKAIADATRSATPSENYTSLYPAAISAMEVQIQRLFGHHIDNYQQTARRKRQHKKAFFVIAIIAWLFLTLIPACLIFLTIQNPSMNDSVNIGIAIGGFAEILTSTIAIPLVIANYLFNKEEDTAHVQLVDKMLVHTQDLIKTEKAK